MASIAEQLEDQYQVKMMGNQTNDFRYLALSILNGSFHERV
jgi:hypothetical protein